MIMEEWEKCTSKILSCKEAVKLISDWKENGEILTFTNGCFDLLHLGHVKYLARAANLGDHLIVGLNSDESVRRLKGDSRPVNTFESRAALLASMSFVDAVVGFEEDTPKELITALLPDILVKGGDYQEDQIVGAQEVRSRGGKVVVMDLEDGYSSTGIINKILEKE